MTRHLISDSIYRIAFAAVAALILCAPSAEAQIVAFDFEDLAIDDDQRHRWDSNLVNDGWSLIRVTWSKEQLRCPLSFAPEAQKETSWEPPPLSC